MQGTHKCWCKATVFRHCVSLTSTQETPLNYHYDYLECLFSGHRLFCVSLQPVFLECCYWVRVTLIVTQTSEDPCRIVANRTDRSDTRATYLNLHSSREVLNDVKLALEVKKPLNYAHAGSRLWDCGLLKVHFSLSCSQLYQDSTAAVMPRYSGCVGMPVTVNLKSF